VNNQEVSELISCGQAWTAGSLAVLIRDGLLCEARRLAAWQRACVYAPRFRRLHNLTLRTRWRDRQESSGASRPVAHGPAGMSAVGMERKRSASGQAAAKARRTRLAVSTTQAATFKSMIRGVANSARDDIATSTRHSAQAQALSKCGTKCGTAASSEP
jgi:hypothetical protein